MLRVSGVLIAALIGALLQACARAPAPVSAVAGTRDAPPLTDLPAPAQTATSTAAVVPTTATPRAVRIVAVDGNLNIRRGPHTAFNPIGVLRAGDQARVVGRDLLSHWALIERSGSSGERGWVSVQTRYSEVAGNLDDVPVVDPQDWPEAAYIRNCTHHGMQVDPGELQLPSVWEFPDNEIRVFPGVYSVTDIDVAGAPEVESVAVREGDLIEIRTDGSGERRKCPVD